jgi:IS1 family transposase
MSSWLFPPQTREVQRDEKWAFVGKKQAHCDPDDPADARQGDHWDHVAFDPEHRFVPAVVAGKRTEANTLALVRAVKQRLGGRVPALVTSDEYRPYKTALLEVYGETVCPPRTGRRGRPRLAYRIPLAALHYGTVHKTRRKGRVVRVDERVIFGDPDAVRARPAASAVSRKINTSFLERHNGTDRNRNARKVRRTYCFSKDWDAHTAVTYFTLYSYNFRWPVRTLRVRDPEGHWQPRTPAHAAGLTDHVWSLTEWLTFPAVQWA